MSMKVNGVNPYDENMKPESGSEAPEAPKSSLNPFGGKIIKTDVVKPDDESADVSTNIDAVADEAESTRQAMEEETESHREFSMDNEPDFDTYIDKNAYLLKDTVVLGKMPILRGELDARENHQQFLEDAKWIGDWEAANDAKLYELGEHAGANTPLKHKVIKGTPFGEIVISGDEIRIRKDYPEGKEIYLKSLKEYKTAYVLYEKQEKVSAELQQVLSNVKYDDIKGEYVYTEPKTQQPADKTKRKKADITDAMWLNGVSVLEAADTQLAGGFVFDRASGYVISGRNFYIVDETTNTIRKVPEGKEGFKQRRNIEKYFERHPEAAMSDNGRTFMEYAASVRRQVEQQRRELAQNGS